MKLTVRPETKKDHTAIRVINDLAFGHSNEGVLIEKLRKTPGFISGMSLVAESGDKVIGHILFHPVKIKDGNIAHAALALAPMSVHPAYQRSGVGKALVKEGLRRARDLGFGSIIVLGHPEYYPRFGFKRASSFGIKAPSKVPENVFFAIELSDGALKNVKGIIEYPKSFNGTV